MSRKLEKRDQPVSIGIRLDNKLNYTDENDDLDNEDDKEHTENDNDIDVDVDH